MPHDDRLNKSQVKTDFAAAQQGQAPPPSQFKIMSSAFSDGSKIPTQFSCADPNATSPALSWSNPPAGVTSFAMIMHDPEGAPMKSSMDVTHWILWNIPPSSTSIMAGVKPDSSPDGIAQGKNVRGVNGYQPACPPPGAMRTITPLNSSPWIPSSICRQDPRARTS